MSKKAMTLALEALTATMSTHGFREYIEETKDKAIKALEEALAQSRSDVKQEQGEPVACIHRNEYNEYRLEPHDNFDIKSIPFNVDVPLFKESPAQKPLTDEQIEGIAQMTCIGISPHEDTLNFARVIEAAHGIKEKNSA